MTPLVRVCSQKQRTFSKTIEIVVSSQRQFEAAFQAMICWKPEDALSRAVRGEVWNVRSLTQLCSTLFPPPATPPIPAAAWRLASSPACRSAASGWPLSTMRPMVLSK